VEELAFAICLSYEDTGALRIVRIVFHNRCFSNPGNNISNRNGICSQFVITVFGDTDDSVLDKPLYLLECLAHKRSW
jgi:hypothetical protein